MVAEIQVRTVLQHAWAEIEHDVQYKSPITIPDSIKRRFMALAGLLEIADREFQAIQDEDERLKKQAAESLQEGDLGQVEITADALKTYLDRSIGSDERLSEVSYEFTARVLRRIGFTTFDQVQACVAGYDADHLSRLRWGWLQGPTSRFEDMLLAGMGATFIERGALSAEWAGFLREALAKFIDNGIPIGDYDPRAEHEEPPRTD